MKLGPIKYETTIRIKDIPLQWLSKFELYYPDLPQFPITYVHKICNGKRIYGFVASSSFNIKEDVCDADVLFISNEKIDGKSYDIIKKEVEERFGSLNKIGIEDIISCCNGNQVYISFFKELWEYISRTFGKYIPYGKFYDEVYSIVRFVSAWQPKTGRQSEMRMLYNFLSIFGEDIKIEGKWNYLEFFLLPTYEEIKDESFNDFPKFGLLYKSMKKIWELFFTKEMDLDGMKIKSMNKSWPQAKDNFMKKITYPLYKQGKITLDELQSIDRLVDAFNRHSWRAAFFIWSIMSIQEKDYTEWDKDFFIKFYLTKDKGVGISPKVVACFLQQGFKNVEAIPIDIWVKSFYELALGIDSEEGFFNSFSQMGKLERAIWLSSQANKTNIKTFFDLMWCTRYGTTGNTQLRGPNPISCYECKLINSCPSYNKIKDEKVIVSEGDKETFNTLVANAVKEGCRFICITRDGVPKKIFELRGKNWALIDEFSGYLLTNQKIKSKKEIFKVKELISSLPSFF